MKMAVYDTEATRTSPDGKLDYEGFLSPLVLERYAQYLHKHRSTPDGGYRDSDNWQLGIPLSAYMKSACRHFLSWWKWHRGWGVSEDRNDLEDSICALLFNAMGYLHEKLRSQDRVMAIPDDPNHQYARAKTQ